MIRCLNKLAQGHFYRQGLYIHPQISDLHSGNNRQSVDSSLCCNLQSLEKIQAMAIVVKYIDNFR